MNGAEDEAKENEEIADPDVIKVGDVKEEDIFCTIKADEVPPVPENKFLMRKSNLQAAAAQENNKTAVLEKRERQQEEKR